MFRIDGNGYEGGERTSDVRSASRSSSDRHLTGEMIRQMNAKKENIVASLQDYQRQQLQMQAAYEKVLRVSNFYE